MKNMTIVLISFVTSAVFTFKSCSNHADFEYDVEDKILAKDLDEGLNLISKSSVGNLEFYVNATSGKKPEFNILLDGKRIKSTLLRKKKSGTVKKTTCWECGVDKMGNRHCWKIPCPVIVRPWVPNVSRKIKIG